MKGVTHLQVCQFVFHHATFSAFVQNLLWIFKLQQMTINKSLGCSKSKMWRVFQDLNWNWQIEAKDNASICPFGLFPKRQKRRSFLLSRWCHVGHGLDRDASWSLQRWNVFSTKQMVKRKRRSFFGGKKDEGYVNCMLNWCRLFQCPNCLWISCETAPLFEKIPLKEFETSDLLYISTACSIDHAGQSTKSVLQHACRMVKSSFKIPPTKKSYICSIIFLHVKTLCFCTRPGHFQ